MTPGTPLLLVTLAAVAFLLFLILYLRLQAFLALLITSFALGLAAGMSPAKLLRSIQFGFGDALGFIAVVVALGSIIGRFLEHSGGGRRLADWLLQKYGPRNTPWALLTSSFLVGLPIFFEVGFIILVPLAWSLARESKRSLLYYGLPIACALTVCHAMVPPHPAPAAAAQLFHADLGKTILYGILISIPMAIAGGIGYGLWIANRIYVPVPEMADKHVPAESIANPPGVPQVLLTLLLPVGLIFLSTFVNLSDPKADNLFTLIGHPFIALLLTTLLTLLTFGWMRGLNKSQISTLANEALVPIGSVLVIMGAGGAFKQVIVDSGVGPYAGQLLASSSISPLLVAYFIATALRIAQGSATVAIITAAGIVAPLVNEIPNQSPELLVLALCAGGTILSHVNDAGFWIVNQYLGMTVPQTLRSWTVMKVITSLVGISIILTVNALR
ncbi:gluconate:H+ symporter [Bryobacter aggregatus]|uniref:GntT/GntP/DsdX family permease n=1 Tax=Bryobacter aggregatus TaxID=360054 RepID=UPI0004E1DEAB|nr:gluconate:H+ symporter [Bryobacter aggregatus]